MDIRIIGGDQSAGVLSGAEASIDPLRGSHRISVSPIDCRDIQGNLLGHYRTVCVSGALVSIGANGILFSARWAGPVPPIAVVTRLQVCVEIITAVTAATPINFEAIAVKSFSVPNTGGGVIVPTRMRANMSLSSFSDFRMATTAALGGGTQTLDPVGFGYASCPPLTNTNATGTAVLITAGNGMPVQDIYKWEPGGHPLILGVNEGFLIRESSAGPTTGTYRVTFIIEHVEVSGF